MICKKVKLKTNCKVVLLEEIRAVTKISGCWVYYVISRQGTEQLECSSSSSLKIKDGNYM